MPATAPIRHVALWGLGAVGTMLAGRILPRLRTGETFRVIADADRIARYRRTPPTFNGAPLVLDYADPATTPPSSDLILVAVKTDALPAACDALTPFLAPLTLLLPLLNGLDAADRLATDFGASHVLRGLVFCNSAARDGHDVVQHGALNVQLGAFRNGPPPTNVADWLRAHDIPAEVPDDMTSALWRKFFLNVGLNQAEAATGLSHGALLASPEAMTLLHTLVDEAAAVAAAEGVPDVPRLVREALDALRMLTLEGKTSMLQDVEAGRHPEIEAFAGTVVALAARHHIPVPANQSLLDRFLHIPRQGRATTRSKRNTKCGFCPARVCGRGKRYPQHSEKST